jgi:hypothetical protein
MNQPDRGTYKSKGKVGQMFYNSCLGKFIIALAVLGLLCIAAFLTVPSEEKMRLEISDDIRQCIQDNDSIQGDQLDDAVGNMARFFTRADTTANDKELMDAFHKYNKLEIYRHSLFATAYIHNNFRPEGTRVGIGILGMVFPTVNFNDFLLRVAPIHRDYGDGVIRSTINYGSDYMGEDPNITPYKGPAE